MRKIHIIIVLVLTFLLIVGICLVKSTNKVTKGMPAINQEEVVIEEDTFADSVTPSDAEELSADVVEQNSAEQGTESQKAESKIKIWQHKISGSKTSVEHKNTETEKQLTDETASKTSKYTPEEEELLKKIPRSNEVIVDKEIKLKSSGKYIFK